MKIAPKMNSRGFTLMELLIAFAIFGMILHLLYNSLTYASKATAQSLSIVNKVESINELELFLRQLIGQSYPQKNAFQGSSNLVEFIAPIAQAGAASELYQLTLEAKGSPQEKQLAMQWKRINAADSQLRSRQLGDKETGTMVLIDNLAEIEFSYLSDTNYPAASIWLSQWRQEQQPTAIRIAIKSLDTKDSQKKEPLRPAMVIAIPRTHSADCQFDPVSRECRDN